MRWEEAIDVTLDRAEVNSHSIRNPAALFVSWILASALGVGLAAAYSYARSAPHVSWYFVFGLCLAAAQATVLGFAIIGGRGALRWGAASFAGWVAFSIVSVIASVFGVSSPFLLVLLPWLGLGLGQAALLARVLHRRMNFSIPLRAWSGSVMAGVLLVWALSQLTVSTSYRDGLARYIDKVGADVVTFGLSAMVYSIPSGILILWVIGTGRLRKEQWEIPHVARPWAPLLAVLIPLVAGVVLLFFPLLIGLAVAGLIWAMIGPPLPPVRVNEDSSLTEG